MPESTTDLAGLRIAAEDFRAAVLETAAQPIWVVDPDGVIRFANPAAIIALGYDAVEDLLGRPSHETIHYQHPDGSHYPAAECPMLRPRATGETVASDLDWFFRRDGSMFPVSYVSVPMELPEGRGAVVAFTDITGRVAAEQELRARDEILAAQQSALRRVAAIVAGGAPSADVFAAIAREVGSLLELPLVELSRYERDGSTTVIGAWSDRPQPFEAGTQWLLDGPGVSAEVRRTGRPVRVPDYEQVPGAISAAARAMGIRSGAGAPIVVNGQLWGVMATCGWDEPLPDRVEERLAEFTALIAAAFSNTASRDELARLADEQAALRRVATLVARGLPSVDVFAAVAREVGLLLGADATHMSWYGPDGSETEIAAWRRSGDRTDSTPAVRSRPPEPDGSAVTISSPIVVEGADWGALYVHSNQIRPLPVDTEIRLANFTELVATAVSNAHARLEAARLADAQAALRRVATLVARESPPADVFAAVAAEVGRLMQFDITQIYRYEADETATAVAAMGEGETIIPVGARVILDGVNLGSLVLRTRRPARIEDYETASGLLGERARKLGVRSGVGAPIVVGGRVWGAICAVTKRREPLPADTEARMEEFTELVATAISNVQARADVAASRARIVAATDDERRRVVRDLHDGAQQRLVQAVLTLKLAQRALDSDQESAPGLVREALEQAERANAELRELAHGILPTILTRGGLGAAVEALASRTPVPVAIDVAVGRLPPAVEATAYFVVAEALTNVAKHAGAQRAGVSARVADGTLSVDVRDDGVGGARRDGPGLVGLADRLAVVDGRLRVESPAGGGTLVAADIPLD